MSKKIIIIVCVLSVILALFIAQYIKSNSSVINANDTQKIKINQLIEE